MDSSTSFFHTIYSYEDLIRVEMTENGSTIYSKSTSRIIGGALIGGVLLGGAGAVIGGLSGNTTENKVVESIKMNLLLRNVDHATYTIICHDIAKLELKKQAYLQIYNARIKGANIIKDALSVVIDRIDRKNSIKETVTVIEDNAISSIKSYSIADELQKLLKLKEQGILTDDEFKKQKAKLLDN